MTFITILLAVIAYILWKIYRQREDEKEEIASEKFDIEWEKKKREEYKDYPYIYGKLIGNWDQVFADFHKKGMSLLKLSFHLMLGESVKIDYSEGSMKWDSLWDASKELLEHLEKYHEGSIAEHEIALTAYWQVAATEIGDLIKASPNTGSLSSGAHTSPISGEKLEVAPFTDIEKIASLFPKKANHPAHEISFFDEKGNFPRESKGSAHIDAKIKALGL